MPLPQRPFGFDDRYGVEQPAAPKKISLREIFNKFAADAMRDFPKLRDSFMLIDGESGVAIGNVDPDKLNIAPQELATIIATQAYSRSPTGGIADTHLVSEELNPYVIKEGAVYAIRFNDYMDVSGNAEKDILFALHHELGHAVVPGALGARTNYDESAGDVFGLLKHIQKFGDDDFSTLLARTRSLHMLSGDVQHFTNLALDAFEEQKSGLDIKNMTPEQMTETARTISEKTQYTFESMQVITDLTRKASLKFANVPVAKGDYVEVEAGEFLKEIARQLCDRSVYADEFKMGMAILKPFFKDIPGQPLPPRLAGPEWGLLKRSLLEKERTVAPTPPKPEVVKPRLALEFPPLPPRPPQSQQLSQQQLLERLFSGRLPRQQQPVPQRRFG